MSQNQEIREIPPEMALVGIEAVKINMPIMIKEYPFFNGNEIRETIIEELREEEIKVVDEILEDKVTGILSTRILCSEYIVGLPPVH